MFRLSIGGRDITDCLAKLLRNQGYNFNSGSEKEIVRDIKEAHAYCSHYPDQKLQETWAREYKLPDGQIVNLLQERATMVEPLFDPTLIGMESLGIHHMLNDALARSPTLFQRALATNITVIGGTSLISGFKYRLERELSELTNEKCVVTERSDSKNSAWKGGAKISQQPLDWISRQDYNEIGNVASKKRNANDNFLSFLLDKL